MRRLNSIIGSRGALLKRKNCAAILSDWIMISLIRVQVTGMECLHQFKQNRIFMIEISSKREVVRKLIKLCLSSFFIGILVKTSMWSVVSHQVRGFRRFTSSHVNQIKCESRLSRRIVKSWQKVHLHLGRYFPKITQLRRQPKWNRNSSD